MITKLFYKFILRQLKEFQILFEHHKPIYNKFKMLIRDIEDLFYPIFYWKDDKTTNDWQNL